jgi:AraC-like DNA-binding protein
MFEKYYTDEKFIYFTHSARHEDAEIMKLIGDMYHTYVEKKCGYELKVQSQFYMLVYLLVTKYRETDVDLELVRSTKRLERLSRIMGYLKDNYMKELSLEELSRIFGYSPTYLSRMFQKYANTTYKACLNQIRLEHAAKELMNTATPVGEIAINNGFPNSKAFAKMFRDQYGILPSEYRKDKKRL